MKKIEFIGGSGVGKTTLFNEIIKHRSDSDGWMTPTEARITLAKKTDLRLRGNGLRGLLHLFLKFNFFKNQQEILANYVLRNYENTLFFESMDQFNDIIDLSLIELVKDKSLEPYKKAKYIEFYVNMILHDIVTIEQSTIDSVIVYDDGIIHNSYATNNESKFHELVERNPSVLSTILPQGAVYCDLNLLDNIERRKKRIATGKGTILEIQQEEEQLYRISEESLLVSKRTISIFEKYKIPVLHLNMADPSEKNVTLFNQFIKGFTN